MLVNNGISERHRRRGHNSQLPPNISALEMAVLKLPAFFAKLAADTPLAADVLMPASVRCSEIADSSEPFFFPEYTDHSLVHITDVLGAVIDIIHEDAEPVLTAKDYVAAALATMLHDIALHIRSDGFLSLVDSANQYKLTFDEKEPSLARLWDEFVSEATRFDSRQLIELFGEDTPVRRPHENALHWSLKDRLLIGEFIRRHHARLAHEIAVFGFPMKDGARVQLLENADQRIRDLVGVIARSHGMSVRGLFSYLQGRYDLRVYDGFHPVFLMVVLRIADNLQLQSSRAPAKQRQLRRIRSPFSEREWRTHASVESLNLAALDPEALNVVAAPPDALTFVRIREWLESLQNELDAAWAVLGEVFGRFSSPNRSDDLTSLKIRIRRVRSNLENVQEFAQTVAYVPALVRFEAAGADLLKLLVGPLYNYEKLIGVRELCQNAVDAGREANDLLAREGTRASNVQRTVRVQLIVEDQNVKGIVISDNGVGMTSEIVMNYFLRAGASFRNSTMWKSLHLRGEHSTVARAGRFGIGALAAFLLGEKIEVHTRHFTQAAEEAIFFEAELFSDNINIVRRFKEEMGTDINISFRASIPPPGVKGMV
jgi:molecular chaperone HtpG